MPHLEVVGASERGRGEEDCRDANRESALQVWPATFAVASAMALVDSILLIFWRSCSAVLMAPSTLWKNLIEALLPPAMMAAVSMWPKNCVRSLVKRPLRASKSQ